MKNSFTENRRILAHMILNIIMSNYIIVRKHGMSDAEKDIYMSKGYSSPSVLKIKESIANKSLDEIRTSCRMLKENGHIKYEEYPVEVTLTKIEILPDGEDAYNSEFYLELNNKEDEERKIKWPQKHWILNTIISAVIGGILAILLQVYFLKILPTSTQSQPTIPAYTDTSMNHKK